jgi:hypothetical protein
MRRRAFKLVVVALTLMAGVARVDGQATASAWPALSDAQQQAALTQLKEFAQQTQTKLRLPMRGFETQYFLFCTDLPQSEAEQWAALLDRMYVKLSELFNVPARKNIWRGKAMVFIFSRKEDYQRYERQMAHIDPGNTAGMCQGFSDGTVKIAFYRQEDQLEFAHVLVHESVHGFLHRYRSTVDVPSWANEGLAETVATDLVPQNGRRNEVMSRAREAIQAHRGLGNFFTTRHIEDWQYPVAEMLCTMMIQASGKNYVDFINGIKDGLPWEKSLEDKYKAPKERLEAVFEQWLGVRAP